MLQAMNNHGLPTIPLIPDGQIHRFGKNNNCWYVYFGNSGAFGDWSRDISEVWRERNANNLTPPERKKLAAHIREAKRIRAEETVRRSLQAAEQAYSLWEKLTLTGSSLYLKQKQVAPYGVRFGEGFIAVPLYDVTGKLWSLQKIHDDGSKRFFPGGKKQGCYHVIGTIEGGKSLYVAEGYATGASIYMATETPCVVAFDAGNLEPVIEALRQKYPDTLITIAADNDQWGEQNTGKIKAKAAAVKHGCAVVVPEFPDAVKEHQPTDFNDLHMLAGLEAVKAQLGKGQAISLSLEETVAALSALSSLAYDQVREKEAKRLGVRVTILDKEVAALRKAGQEHSEKAGMFPQVTLWPEPVEAALLLDELTIIIQRFIICEENTAIASALWCAFTWVIDVVQVAPLAIITAPEKRCGKSQLLTLIGKLSRRPLVASNISPAAVYRVIEAHGPTLLIDEADSFLKENEEMRGVINSGHTRQSAYVIRTVGEDHEPYQFSTWGAKAISGIGALPETLMDRAVILELRRKLPHETVERLRYAEPGLFDTLISKLARFAEDAGPAIYSARPQLPASLHDRAQDNWEPLLAIADYAGGNWPEKARMAALALSGAEQEAISLSAELLADIHEIFQEKHIGRVTTADLLEYLTEDELKPWATYNRGKPMSPRQLAKRLEEYGISSKNLKTGCGQVRKGFEHTQFADAFARYLTSSQITPVLTATALPPGQKPGDISNREVAEQKTGSATLSHPATAKPAAIQESSPVAAKIAITGNRVEVEI